MQLDELVCRGTLVFDKGRKYVIARIVQSTLTHTKEVLYYDAIEITEAGDYLVGNSFFDMHQDVDSYFPGPVVELPDYIKYK